MGVVSKISRGGMMHSYLKEILEHKKNEVNALYRDEQLVSQLSHFKETPRKKDSLTFKRNLSTPGINVIAEVKRKSPSKGILAEIKDPVALAKCYADAGCAAISVLTDSFGFSGSMDDLKKIVASVNCPVLRKDFIIDEIQLIETALSGASAVLLIVAVLGDQTEQFLSICNKLGLAALVEVHTRDEIKLAIDAGADIIGVNNRNLETFHVDPNHARKLVQYLPPDIIKVSESGIHDFQTAISFYDSGYNAVLIGEALVTAADPKNFINQLKTVK